MSKVKNNLLLSLFIAIVVSIPSLTYAQKTVRSYYRWQTTGQSVNGPISDLAPGAVTAEWYDNGFLQIKLGTLTTLTWISRGQARNGNHVYEFKKSQGVVMPGTLYQSVIFSADWSVMQINYLFGLGGFNKIQMNSVYKFLDEGDNAADKFNQEFYGR